MVRLEYLIFGYVDIEFSDGGVAFATDALLRSGISVRFISSGVARVAYRDVKRICEVLSDKVEYKCSEVGGLPGLFMRERRRYGVIAGLVIVLILACLSSLVVWDVRIDGCESGSEDEIVSALYDNGLRVGALWSRIDRSKIEVDTLSECDGISWINVNRRGTVAYVKVAPRVLLPSEEEPRGYASIVASRDCIIEEIRVESGVAMVKVGESVRRGEVLISGVIPEEVGGGFCYAKGSVKGRFSDSVSVFQSRAVEQYGLREVKTAKICVNFFGFSINIFKNYRNCADECDIIEKNRDFSLPGGKKLPFSLTFTYLEMRERTEMWLSEDETASLAREKMSDELSALLSDRELLRMKTTGNFDGDGYLMRTDVVCIGDVTSARRFEVDLEIR